MSIDVVKADSDQFERWNDYVERSSDTNPFHRAEALEVQAGHSGTDLHALVGYKGEEPVGLLPIFELERGPLTAVFSPPPPLWIFRLGPATVNRDQVTGRKLERRKRRFIDGCFEWLDENVGAHLLRVTTEPEYHDLRPFKWNDATVTPSYTYVIDLAPDEDDLIMQFSQDARQNIRVDGEYTIEEGDATDVARIIEQVRARYEGQGLSFGMPTSFAEDLYDKLPDGTVRAYVCYAQGEFAGGSLCVEDEERSYSWLGGVKPDDDLDLPVNDLLEWHGMLDAKERGLEQFELVGADDLRTTRFKAKFSPTLETFFNVEYGQWPVPTLVGLYQRTRYNWERIAPHSR